MADAGTAVLSLEVRRTFRAPRDRVFAAWTRPEQLSQWAAPGLTTAKATVDLRVGGEYRITMTGPDGSVRVVGGTYEVIDPPARLVYSWQWKDRENATNTRVTVEFHDRGATTDVVLRHEGFSTEQDCKRHEDGWNACVPKLDTLVSQER